MTTSSPALALAPGTIPVPGTGANTGLTFYLLTHHPGWLRTTAVLLLVQLPLFAGEGGAA